MIKKELETDRRFMRVCSKYDIYLKDISVYGNLILLSNPSNDMYILLDEDYNTIAVENAYISDTSTFVNSLYEEYSRYSKNKKFSYPFEKINFKQIVDMANRITLSCEEDEIFLTINGIDCVYKNKDDYSMLLAYLKFLGKEIKNYQSYVFINKQMGRGVMDVTTYIDTLIDKINEFIEISVRRKKVVDVDELIGYMNNEEFEYDEYKFLLNEIIKLLLKQKGYKIENNQFEKNPIFNMSNLSDKVKQLLPILSMSTFDFRRNIKNYQPSEAKDIFEVIILSERRFRSKKLLNMNRKN